MTAGLSRFRGSFVLVLAAFAAQLVHPQSVSPVSVNPAAGGGLSQTFTFTFQDVNGYSDLYVLDVLISTFLDGQTACYFALAPTGATTGYIYLVDDAGDGGYAGPPMPLPSNSVVQNSQCAINGTGSSISASGNTLTLTLAITFKPAFVGNKAFYMAARSNTQNSGWQALGTWNVPGSVPPGPAVGTVSPARSTSTGQTYTFTFTDTNGYSDLFVLDVLTNSILDGVNACYFAYVPTTPTNGYLYLVDDAGDGGYVSGSPIGLSSGGVLQNSQCEINTAGSSASESGNTLTLNLAIAFKSGFAGNQVFYLAARNNSTGNSGWQAAGSVTVPSGPSITSITPNSGQPGQTLPSVAVVGHSTNFVNASTVANFGDGITVNSTAVTDSTHASVSITISSATTLGTRTVTMTTGAQVVSLPNGFSVTAAGGAPTITDFNPKNAPVGTLITVTGTNLQPATGTAAQFTLAKQGSGTLAGFATTTSPTSLTFVIPAGAATGTLSLTVNGQTANAATPLTITPPSSFTLTAAPSTASLIRGQSAAYAVSLATSSGFDQLAALSVTGLPTGVTATFQPQQITVGQTAVLTVTAPAGQALGPSSLTVSASATVSGISVLQSAAVTLNVQPITTSFLGRTVVSNSAEMPLAGVTIKMLGVDGNGNTTGCSGNTVSDGGGNFLLSNLAANCVGPQLVGFNGTTVTSPAGTYAGVNLVFTFTSGQVTASPVLVHLPRIDNVETFLVTQNSSVNQTYAFTSIPGLSVTVYAGTIFTMQGGAQPNPFPLAAVQVPVDRLPDAKPQVPTMMRAFIVAFQPANATTNEPVAVYFPNTLNTPPGTDMALMTLDPTHGQMVPYGSGAVSSDGTQIVPDPDPAHPGHLYGLIHFDWHGPMPPPPPTNNPSPTCGCNPGATCFCPATAGKPVDISSGIDVIKATDISINGPRGNMSIERTLRTMSSTPGPFGIGSNFNYGAYLLTFAYVTSDGPITLVMPDGNQFSFSPQLNGTLTNMTIPTLRGAVITIPSSGIYKLKWKNGTVYEFQANGNRTAYFTSIVDPNGNTTSLTLNPSVPGQVTQVTDAVGRSLNLTYDASNRITLIADPIGRTLQYTYNAAGYLATVTDPNGGVTTYSYNGNNLISITDPRNIVVEQNTYDANGRVVQQIEADGGIYQFAYTLLNPLVGSSPPVMTIVTDPRGQSTTYRFTPTQLLTDVTDSSGQSRTFALDPAHNNLVSGISGTAACSACGDSTHGNQNLTLDANGNILTITDQLGNTTTYTYELVFNKVTSIADPLGDTTRFTYDVNGNLLTRTDPNGNATTFTYNSFGQVTQITDPLSQRTTFAYDSFGNLTMVTDALGNATNTVYDALSRPIQTIDALGRRSQTAYDALGRVVSQTNAQFNATHFSYDADSNLISLRDVRGNTTSFTYDPMNRLLTRTTPLGTSDSRTYDLNGNLISFRDRRGQTSSFGYDNLNRLVSETYADSTVARSYDANGRPVQVNDSASGLFGFIYDLAGRLTGAVAPVGSLQYTYDAASRMASRQVAGQAALTYSYDAAGNLNSASMPSASVMRTYDPRNLLLTASRANGVTSQNTYDALGRVASIAHTGLAGVINSQTYGYDSVGNRISSTSGMAQSLITPAVATAAYDVNNKQNQFGSTANTFDPNGNLASSSGSGGTTTYTWDSRNRLASITTSAGQTTRFTYDFAGNLIQQLDAGASLNLTQTFLLDNLTNVAFASRSDGDQYSVLAGRSIDDNIAATHASGQVEYGLTDAINSTIATVNEAGSLHGHFLYEPYGQTTASGSTYPFQFTGREPAAGSLAYYRARFYNAASSRFISEDPIGYGGRDFNLYRYAANSPGVFADPTGQRIAAGQGACLLGCLLDFLGPSTDVQQAIIDASGDVTAILVPPFKPFWDAISNGKKYVDFLNCSKSCLSGSSCPPMTPAVHISATSSNRNGYWVLIVVVAATVAPAF
jgi:RHS repeat-associated protein